MNTGKNNKGMVWLVVILGVVVLATAGLWLYDYLAVKPVEAVSEIVEPVDEVVVTPTLSFDTARVEVHANEVIPPITLTVEGANVDEVAVDCGFAAVDHAYWENDVVDVRFEATSTNTITFTANVLVLDNGEQTITASIGDVTATCVIAVLPSTGSGALVTGDGSGGGSVGTYVDSDGDGVPDSTGGGGGGELPPVTGGITYEGDTYTGVPSESAHW